MKEDVWIPSFCYMCYCPCGIRVHRVDGVVVKIEGDPDCPQNMGRLCAKGNAGIMGLYNPNHVKKPLRRTNPEKGIGVDPKWEEISRKEAMDIIVEKLRKVREDNPNKLMISHFDVGVAPEIQAAWTAAFGMKGLFWTTATWCGAALHLYTYLTNASFHAKMDLDYCNYVLSVGTGHGFMVGCNPNITAQKMADARIRGMKVAVVDPICSIAAAKADEWIPIRPGTDGAMALAMINVLLNELGIYDREFLKKHTNGPYLIKPDGYYVRDKETNKPLVWDVAEGKAKLYDADVKEYAIEGEYKVNGVECWPAFQKLKEHVKKYVPEEVSEITTVPAETMRRVAKEFGEAASIGSKIVIDGVEFPYRPVSNHQYRGTYAHKHGTQTAMAYQLMNLIVGSLYVPGAHCGTNLIGPSSAWEPKEGPDGLILAAKPIVIGSEMYEFLDWEEGRLPDSVDLHPLFPAAWVTPGAYVTAILEAEKFQIPMPEVLLHCRCNIVMTSADKEKTAQALKKIPFIVSFVQEIDETAEFADIVLPEPHYLQRFDPFPNPYYISCSSEEGYWFWGIRQPVVGPMGEEKHWFEVLIEIAERLGFLGDFNELLNAAAELKAPYRLSPNKRYNLEELADVWCKSKFGPEKDLAWFKENGYVKVKRTVKEKYPMPFIKQRIPIYYEHFIKAGEYAKKGWDKLGLPLDDWDYRPLPDWKPCPAYEMKDPKYDLYVVSYTYPFHTFSFTLENPWLCEIGEEHPFLYKVLMNLETGFKKGVRSGDIIKVESTNGSSVEGEVKLSQCIHPEVIAIGGIFGARAKGKPIAKGKGLHFNTLMTLDLEHLDYLSLNWDACVKAKVSIAKKGGSPLS